MQLNEILAIIYNSKKILVSAKSIAQGTGLHDDLVSELIMIVSEMNLDFLNKLQEKKELEVYCYKIMYYQFTNPKMNFYKNYRQAIISNEEEDPYDIDGTYLNVTQLLSKIEKEIAQKRYPTEIRLLELYVEHGTYRKVGDAVGISFKTVQYLVKQVIEKIRSDYDISYNS